MNNTQQLNTTQKTQLIRSTVSVVTVISYILYSAIRRLEGDTKLFFIPLVISIASIAIIIETGIGVYKMHKTMPKKELRWMVLQTIINIGLALLCGSYIAGM
ncbi:MAG: hypothetical protein LCH58_02130 [Bacteroidetes bacterium]|uniref:hypothetical protein n=1 Tax=Phnomibacter sp. TaxID=2836217 RepID=UPI002FDE64E4|nr:hypothetical protein [Bacteroidota bacterium]